MKIKLIAILASVVFVVSACSNSPVRDSGYSPSGNGASSFHLIWNLPVEQSFIEVSTVLTVEEKPEAHENYFWALEVVFFDGQTNPDRAGAHIGLMHEIRSDNADVRKINWSGYGMSSILEGTDYQFPIEVGIDDDGIVDYIAYGNWEIGTSYKLTVRRVQNETTIWRGEIQNLSTGETRVIRDLFTSGTSLKNIVVWSEVKARCDGPSVSAVWSDFEAITEDGKLIKPESVWVNYQSYENGGCTNTNSEFTEFGIRQTTNTKREIPQDSIIVLN